MQSKGARSKIAAAIAVSSRFSNGGRHVTFRRLANWPLILSHAQKFAEEQG
jgi:hypothetical protein